MITITMPKWWAIAMAMWFGLDIVKMLLSLISITLERGRKREQKRRLKKAIWESIDFDKLREK